MNCPVCKDKYLHTQALEPELIAQKCDGCGGHWIQAFQYWKWLQQHGPILPEKPASEGARLEVGDTKEAKICPECGRVLTRCKVGHDVDFWLDRCATCGGLWFDRNEWEILKSRNLHDEVHLVFGRVWQHEVAAKEKHKVREDRTREILGDRDFEEARRIKTWVSAHPKMAAIMAFLADPNA